MKKKIWKKLLVFLVLFGMILAGFVFLYFSVREYNSRERIIEITGENQDMTGKDCAVSIQPRGGSTDSWSKDNVDDDGNVTKYEGMIYEMIVTNQSRLAVSDWSVKIELSKDCYVNNAWCGEVEFHQHIHSGEKVQMLDLRTCMEQKTNFLIDIVEMGSDLMIPMNTGDYIIYHASYDEKENYIRPVDPAEEENPSVRTGIIFYQESEGEEEPLVFSKMELHYKLHMDMKDSPFLWVLLAEGLLWFMVLVVNIGVVIKTKHLVRKTENDARIIKESMSAFMGFIDAKDPSTNGHSRRVAAYAKRIAQRYGLPEEEAQKIYYMGLMHDCGKIGIPDAILGKPGKLTDEEFEIIKTHTTEGAKILQNFTSISYIREAALYHHERYDGKGYPEGLAGEEIPLVARIICVADSFDAMNSDRCYRPKLSPEEIMEQLEKNRGTQFDPKIADCLLELLKEGVITFDVPGENK